MDLNFEEPLFSDVVKASDDHVAKKEVEDGELWRYGGCSKSRKPDFGENQKTMKRKWTPAMEAYSCVTEQCLNAEVKEAEPPFLLADNQAFNAHDFFTYEAIVKNELGKGEEGLEKQDKKKKMCPVYGCSVKCSSDEDLQKHMMTHRKPVHCGVCWRSWPTASALRIHHRSHSGEKPFECFYCGRRYAHKQHMQSHMDSIHLGMKKHSCTECGYKTAYSSALSNHMKNVHKM